MTFELLDLSNIRSVSDVPLERLKSLRDAIGERLRESDDFVTPEVEDAIIAYDDCIIRSVLGATCHCAVYYHGHLCPCTYRRMMYDHYVSVKMPDGMVVHVPLRDLRTKDGKPFLLCVQEWSAE